MTRRVVLVGCGHAHALVLERWPARVPGDVDLTVITDRERAVYSGMVPGFVAGEYDRQEIEINVRALAERAGARLILGAATRIDAERRRVEVEGCDPLSYDVASLNVGSTVGGLGVPGVREHATATRPIGGLVDALRRSRVRGGTRVVVVGAGAAGVELALALDTPGGEHGSSPGHVALVDMDARVLAGYRASVSRRVQRILVRRGVELRLGRRVVAVNSDCVRLEDGRRLDSDLTVWAAGAAPHPFAASSGLPLDLHGFVNVDATLRVEGFPDLLAAGDCASHPQPLAKAGVHAVRQAPVLYDNIVALLGGRPPRSYRPRSDFLTLLNLGDGTAFGTKWGLSAQGRFVWWIKDRIDRGFMRRLQL